MGIIDLGVKLVFIIDKFMIFGLIWRFNNIIYRMFIIQNVKDLWDLEYINFGNSIVYEFNVDFLRVIFGFFKFNSCVDSFRWI